MIDLAQMMDIQNNIKELIQPVLEMKNLKKMK